ncbi:TIGR02206 family membrane protein [Alkalicoccus halolimnae]|uniref:TIGR02206 family membrane protein n=1 Tax=Alkalicoccus halolimnae TaxID=1667239 RepID=A0A5C7F6G3_9BACI|nr:TIGR02206 family membrane protein [Alkalicoccus halolimnae]TXF85160.1 TIGR02206 family membrane protein [Alkalicoccus halolimnae]
MFIGGDSSLAPFEMFQFQHIIMITLLFIGIIVIYVTKNKKVQRSVEIITALSLILFEISYQLWLLLTGNWEIHHALPLELSSISIILVIILLLTGKRELFEITFFIAIGGALQAVVTPVLNFGWPHFRYWHFFYTHIAVIWAVFYFLWHKAYRLKFWSVIKALIFLNLLLPFIWLINNWSGGNYWFIMEKPAGGSLLNYLGPEPWYILGMEAAAVVMFTALWLIFGRGKESVER